MVPSTLKERMHSACLVRALYLQQIRLSQMRQLVLVLRAWTRHLNHFLAQLLQIVHPRTSWRWAWCPWPRMRHWTPSLCHNLCHFSVKINQELCSENHQLFQHHHLIHHLQSSWIPPLLPLGALDWCHWMTSLSKMTLKISVQRLSRLATSQASLFEIWGITHNTGRWSLVRTKLGLG